MFPSIKIIVIPWSWSNKVNHKSCVGFSLSKTRSKLEGDFFTRYNRPKFTTQLSISVLYDLINKKAPSLLKKSDFGFLKIFVWETSISLFSLNLNLVKFNAFLTVLLKKFLKFPKFYFFSTHSCLKFLSKIKQSN